MNKPTPTNVISLFSYRGGTGKSTFTSNMAVQCAKKHKTILLDLDLYSPQLTYIFNIRPTYFINDFYATNVLQLGRSKPKKISLSQLVVSSGFQNLDLVLADPMIELRDSFILHEDATSKKLFPLLQNLVSQLKEDYDVIILDCPGEVNYYTLNAVALSNRVIGTIMPTDSNVHGTLRILELFKQIKATKIIDIFFTMISTQESEIKEEILKAWKEDFLAVGVRKCIFSEYSSDIAYRHQFAKNYFYKPDDNEYQVLEKYIAEITERKTHRC